MANSENVVVGANGQIYTAPFTDSLALPEDITTSVDSAFMEAGYVSEDGVTLTVGGDTTDINAWQSFYPLRKLRTSQTAMVAFVAREYSPDNVSLAYGGGDLDTSTGVAIYTPPAPGDIDTRALVVQWEDDDATFRLVAPRGLISGDVATTLNRTSAADLPLNFECTPVGTPDVEDLSTQPFYIISDHPDWDPGS